MSDERISLTLANPQQAYQQLLRAWGWAKAMLFAGHRLVLELRPEKRSDAQNRLLHSRINDVRKQCEWAGRKWDTDEWKRLLTAAWCRTRNEGVEMVPSIDGKGFDVLYQRTSKLSRRECADLSEFVMAWGTEQGVQWCAASLGRDGERIDAETGEILEAA
jgi:hypothetical protein